MATQTKDYTGTGINWSVNWVHNGTNGHIKRTQYRVPTSSKKISLKSESCRDGSGKQIAQSK